MRHHLSTWKGVTVAAVLTTLLCVVVTQTMVFFLFQGQDLAAALALAPIISVVITMPVSFFIWSQVRRNQLLSKELQRLVNRDRLTDVATRDFFFARMQKNPTAYGTSLMVDIDFFKRVNDDYGHMAGDAVISRVADILRNNTRSEDIVCRFGGEEFVVFLSEKDSTDGYEVAERMRLSIADEIVEFDGQDLKVTVSIGGSLKERLADVNLAIQQADEALYLAKSGGRNRTVFAENAKTGPRNAAA